MLAGKRHFLIIGNMELMRHSLAGERLMTFDMNLFLLLNHTRIIQPVFREHLSRVREPHLLRPSFGPIRRHLHVIGRQPSRLPHRLLLLRQVRVARLR